MGNRKPPCSNFPDFVIGFSSAGFSLRGLNQASLPLFVTKLRRLKPALLVRRNIQKKRA